MRSNSTEQRVKEHDHALARRDHAVTTADGMKVLINCEDQTQIALGKEMLFDPLPDT